MKATDKGYTLKLREGRSRRAARRQGMRLIKSARRDPLALDYRHYWLVRVDINATVLGGQWGVPLDEVERYLLHRHEQVTA